MGRNEMRWRLREPQTPNWAPGYETFPICEMKGTNQSLFPSSLTFECLKLKEPHPLGIWTNSPNFVRFGKAQL